MKILNKKLCRDIKQNLSQFITIFLMVFIGIMAYSGIEGYMEGMQETADKFYGNYNLQDLNVLGEINESKIQDIKNIDNVKNVEGKLVINTILEENSDVTLQASFIDSNEISKFYIVDGKKFNKDPQNQNVTMTRKYLESLGIEYKPDSLYTNTDLSGKKEIENVEVISN